MHASPACQVHPIVPDADGAPAWRTSRCRGASSALLDVQSDTSLRNCCEAARAATGVWWVRISRRSPLTSCPHAAYCNPCIGECVALVCLDHWLSSCRDQPSECRRADMWAGAGATICTRNSALPLPPLPPMPPRSMVMLCACSCRRPFAATAASGPRSEGRPRCAALLTVPCRSSPTIGATRCRAQCSRSWCFRPAQSLTRASGSNIEVCEE